MKKPTRPKRCSKCNKIIAAQNRLGFCSACYLRVQPWKGKVSTEAEKYSNKPLERKRKPSKIRLRCPLCDNEIDVPNNKYITVACHSELHRKHTIMIPVEEEV